jgi:hypothetical protein
MGRILGGHGREVAHEVVGKRVIQKVSRCFTARALMGNEIRGAHRRQMSWRGSCLCGPTLRISIWRLISLSTQRKNMKFIKSSIVAMAIACGAIGSANANLVSNGGFESGTYCTSGNGVLAGWSGDGAFQNDAACVGAAWVAHSGSMSAAFGFVGTLGSISQDLATVVGQSYHLTYFMASDNWTPNQFVVSVDGVELFNQSNIGGGFEYVQYDFDFVATDSATTLTFSGRDDPAWLRLDDVSVEANGTVPEPTTLALLGLAVIGMGAARRRK